MERFKECLSALVPYYDEDGSNATLIFTTAGAVFPDRRTVKWNLRRLARLYSVDLEAARRNQREFFHYRQGLPLPLSAELVLVPLKTRKAVGKNDGCHSYLNPSAIVSAAAAREGAKRSTILLPGEHLLPCLYSVQTVRKRLRDGAIALERHRSVLLSPGCPAEDFGGLLRELVKALIAGIQEGGG